MKVYFSSLKSWYECNFIGFKGKPVISTVCKLSARGFIYKLFIIHDDLFWLFKRYNIREISFDRWDAVQKVPEEKIACGGNPVFRCMMDDIYIRTDPTGSIKPGKEKSTEKIDDGAVATTMALDRAIRGGNDISENVYNNRELIFI